MGRTRWTRKQRIHEKKCIGTMITYISIKRLTYNKLLCEERGNRSNKVQDIEGEIATYTAYFYQLLKMSESGPSTTNLATLRSLYLWSPPALDHNTIKVFHPDKF